MNSPEDFEKAYKIFAKLCSPTPCSVLIEKSNGQGFYNVTEVADEFVIILQNTTRKKHLKSQLKDLFTKGKFKAPKKPDTELH